MSLCFWSSWLDGILSLDPFSFFRSFLNLDMTRCAKVYKTLSFFWIFFLKLFYKRYLLYGLAKMFCFWSRMFCRAVSSVPRHEELIFSVWETSVSRHNEGLINGSIYAPQYDTVVMYGGFMRPLNCPPWCRETRAQTKSPGDKNPRFLTLYSQVKINWNNVTT